LFASGQPTEGHISLAIAGFDAGVMVSTKLLPFCGFDMRTNMQIRQKRCSLPAAAVAALTAGLALGQPTQGGFDDHRFFQRVGDYIIAPSLPAAAPATP